MAKMLKICPSCGERLKIATLVCGGCGIELHGEFEEEERPFNKLTDEETEFLIQYLRYRGNVSQLQERLGISYPTVKRKLNELLKTLGLCEEEKSKEEVDMSNWQVNEKSEKASEIVKAKLIACGGKARVYTLRDKIYDVKIVDKDHFACDGIIPRYEYRIFDVIVDQVVAQGGRAKKGSGRERLGSPKCGEDTIAAAILKNYWKADTGFDPGFVMIAILEWAGVLHNRRGYVELTAQYKTMRVSESDR